MAKQVITITMDDEANIGLKSPVSVKMDVQFENEQGSMSLITAAAFKSHFHKIMKFVGNDVARNVSNICREMGNNDVH
ncbi:hypothetical protein J8N54_001678 [Salmonella enterica]|nr:hypothetical protein [Salmonella enterica]EBN1281123.1 hypothetical protein [Salmonella enterica]EBR6994658.1 hypothetical protein [Salmonella enterica]EHH5781192.1 hypothetical protein [Salmonella enterica]